MLTHADAPGKPIQASQRLLLSEFACGGLLSLLLSKMRNKESLFKCLRRGSPLLNIPLQGNVLKNLLLDVISAERAPG
jgi:hypothetical protein